MRYLFVAYVRCWLHGLWKFHENFRSKVHRWEYHENWTVGGKTVTFVGCSCGRAFYSTENDPYTNLAVLTKVTRTEAKRRIHARCYGGD